VSALLVSVDYRAKRLDVAALRRGELWELMNLLPLLEGLEVAFRRATIERTAGVSQVLSQLIAAWSADLDRTQVLRSLTGVTPIRSFANVGGSLAEMVLLPLQQHWAGQGSQRVSRTVLRSLVSFLRHLTVESIDLTERIFVGTQTALEYVSTHLSEEDGVSSERGIPRQPLHALASGDEESDAWTSVERGTDDFLQPRGAAEGIAQAAASLSRAGRDASRAVVLRPLLEFRRGASRRQVLQSVATGIPVCVLRPAIGASAAAATTLRGVRNSFDPLHRREAERKYRGPQ